MLWGVLFFFWEIEEGKCGGKSESAEGKVSAARRRRAGNSRITGMTRAKKV